MSELRLAIHGGAGVIDRETFGGEREGTYRQQLKSIAAEAYALLRQGASALDAAQHAVCLLEDCPYFNAGHGSVLNSAGEAEMDAAVMEGQELVCGAVASVRTARNPIMLARAVLEYGDHVMLCGAGADQFGAQRGVVQANAEYFVTEDRLTQLASAAAAGRVSLDHDEKYGTVGAVARDVSGHVAAATSTGGMTNKLPGRVGDTPVIGSGTWADNRSCAVSATGHGEFFIRVALAHDIHARMMYGGQSLTEAADAALAEVESLGGSGGLIAIAGDGEMVLPFNSPGMYRAWVGGDGVVHQAIYQD